MRKVLSLVILLSGFSFGCGSDGDSGDGDKIESDGGNNGGSDADGGDSLEVDASNGGGKYPDCDRSATPAEIPGYEGAMPMFSTGDLTACQMKCSGMGAECFNDTNCPGVELWNDCAFSNLIACVGSEGKACRSELEEFECCAAASSCDPESEDPACIQAACGTEIMDFQECFNGDSACNMSAPQACFSATSASAFAPSPTLRATSAVRLLKALVRR